MAPRLRSTGSVARAAHRWLVASTTALTLGSAVLLVSCSSLSSPSSQDSTSHSSPAATSAPAASPAPATSPAVNGAINLTFSGAVSGTLTSASVTCPSNLQGAEQLGTYAVMIVGTTNSGVSVQIEVSQNKFTGGGTYSAAQADFLEGTIGGNGYIPDPNNTTASMTIVNDGNSGSLSNLTALPVANPAGTAVSLSGTFTCGSNSSGG